MNKNVFQFITTLDKEVGGAWFTTTTGDIIGACRGVPFAFLSRALGSDDGVHKCLTSNIWVITGEVKGRLPNVERAISLVKAKTGLE